MSLQVQQAVKAARRGYGAEIFRIRETGKSTEAGYHRPMPRIATLVTKLARSLGSVSQARAEARWLRQHSPRSFAENLRKRIQGWPLQYLLGPETEHWTLQLAETLRGRISRDKPLRVLDLCTGTACIPLLLCHSLPPRTISAWAIDVSPQAVELARDNVTRCGYGESSGGNTVHVDRQDMFSSNFVQSLKQNEISWEPYDVLTSNPPYIPREEYDKLSHTVRAYEDPLALLGEYPASTPDSTGFHSEHDNKGLTFYVRIASLVQYHNLVRPGGCIALEVGRGQARAVERMFLPFVNHTEVWVDPWGIERVVFARV
ncbi:hypothetical protein FRC10_011299 [Ceratobasidium sp. 414]|nr:hypothetical protein FRC10_011299 [Ceratobasidium sp. 414]